MGFPDEMLGEVPRAFVALTPSADAASPEVLDLNKAELACFEVAVSIETLPELPKGPTGKILRRMLQIRSATDPDSVVSLSQQGR